MMDHGPKAVVHWGKRIGVVRKRTVLTSKFEEMSLCLDLAVYSARPGRNAPIERYRRMARLPADSDEAKVLDAMCQSRFSVFVVKRRHATAGLVLEDLIADEKIWLMDDGFEQSASEGMAFASRVIEPDDFHMTTGAAIPMTRDDLEEAWASIPFRDGSPTRAVDTDPRFVEAVYRVAISRGLMVSIEYR
jgi:hypothetical protein